MQAAKTFLFAFLGALVAFFAYDAIKHYRYSQRHGLVVDIVPAAPLPPAPVTEPNESQDRVVRSEKVAPLASPRAPLGTIEWTAKPDSRLTILPSN